MIDYLRDPDAIYDKSFATIKSEAKFDSIPHDAQHVAVRIMHACGMSDIGEDLRISPDFVKAASSALRSKGAIIVDAEMVHHGIMRSRLPQDNPIHCKLNDPAAKDICLRDRTTRSAAAVELWVPHLANAFVVIGNAPTALFALLEFIDKGAQKPAVIAAFPVGFVGAAEAKAELVRDPRGIAYATLLGRRGGSAMAAATVNAILLSRLS